MPNDHSTASESLNEVLRNIEAAIDSKRELSERFGGRNWEAGWAEGARWVLNQVNDHLAHQLVGYGVRVNGQWEGGALDRGEKRLPMNMPLPFAEFFVSMYKDEGKHVTLHPLFAGRAINESELPE